MARRMLGPSGQDDCALTFRLFGPPVPETCGLLFYTEIFMTLHVPSSVVDALKHETVCERIYGIERRLISPPNGHKH